MINILVREVYIMLLLFVLKLQFILFVCVAFELFLAIYFVLASSTHNS